MYCSQNLVNINKDSKIKNVQKIGFWICCLQKFVYLHPNMVPAMMGVLFKPN